MQLLKKGLLAACTLICCGLLPSSLSAQCNLTVSANPATLPCGGGPVTFTASAVGGSTFALNNDFNGGVAGVGWSVSPAGVFNNPCGPSLNNTTHMWMGNTTAAPRTLQSAALDVSCGGNICFDLKFATQGVSAPCEGPDQPNEGVYLQWSLSAAGPWTDIFYFQPNVGTGAYTTWQNYCFPIPLPAQTTATYFQWYQSGSSGTCCDHWGIDEVTISSNACIATYYYDWLNGVSGQYDSTLTLNITQDTTVNVIYTNGVDDTCYASINVVTAGLMPPVVTLTDEICQFAADGTMSLAPVDGIAPYTYTLVGPGGPYTANTTGTWNNLPPGTFDCFITDAIGCTYNQVGMVIGPGPTCCTYTTTNAADSTTCSGSADGAVYAGAQGGLYPPMTFAWFDTGGTPYGVTDTFMLNLPADDYIVEITDTAGCLQILTITVEEPDPVTLNFQAFDAICNGYTNGYAIVIPSGGTPSYQFQWDANPASSQATYNNLGAGAYNLLVTDTNNCTADTAFAINEPVAVTIDNVVIVDELCLGNCTGSIDITAALADSFSIDNGLTYQTTGIFNSLCAGTYQVMVADSIGCFDTATVVVGSPLPLSLTTSNDTAICTGGNAVLDALASGGVGGYNYFWDGGLGGGPTQNVGNPGSWNIYALDANGCSTDTLPITVSQSPPLQVATSPDIAICWGQSTTFNAVGAGGNFGPYTYTWSGGALAGTGPTQTVAPTSTTTYTVTISDGCGTTPATDNIVVTVNQLPVVDMSVDIPAGCTRHDVVFTNTTPAATVASAFWSFGDGTTGTNNTTENHSFYNAVCYDVSLVVTTPEGCVDSLTVVDMVCVWPLPVADFSFGPQPTTILEPTINFENLSAGASSYVWTIPSQNVVAGDDDYRYVFPNDEPGTYEVCLEAYTSYGCSDTTCADVIIGPSFHLYAPNAFTPDGDGINDFWYIQGRSIDESDFKLLVFNRWGEVIWETNDVNEAWDGTRNGKKLETETYVWKVVTKDKHLGDKKEFTGHVTILR